MVFQTGLVIGMFGLLACRLCFEEPCCRGYLPPELMAPLKLREIVVLPCVAVVHSRKYSVWPAASVGGISGIFPERVGPHCYWLLRRRG